MFNLIFNSPKEPTWDEWAQENTVYLAGAAFLAAAVAKKVFNCLTTLAESRRLTFKPEFLFPPFLQSPNGQVTFEQKENQGVNELEHRIYHVLDKVEEKLERNLKSAAEQKNRECDHSNITKFLFGNLDNKVLSKVKTQKNEVAAIASLKGSHAVMEDCFFVGSNVSAVFDGHGPVTEEGEATGAQASEFAAENFAGIYNELLSFFEANISTALVAMNTLKMSFVKLDRAYTGFGGTTANVCLKTEDYLYVANAGDSRAIVVTDKEIVQLSKDANLNEPEFAKGVKKRGGEITNKENTLRIQGLVAMARAIGDHYLAGAMSARPKITRWKISGKNCHLLQATDGLFNVMSTRQVGGYLQKRLLEGIEICQIAKELVAIARSAGSQDDITVLVRAL